MSNEQERNELEQRISLAEGKEKHYADGYVNLTIFLCQFELVILYVNLGWICDFKCSE